MLQKPWFKVFIYFITSFFFFLAAAILISLFKPGPSEAEVMKFMSAMMIAMNNSIMGLVMTLEHEQTLKSVVLFSSTMLVPIIIISIITGYAIRIMPWRNRK